MHNKKLHIITFGCQMNEADSENIAFSFKKRDFELTGDLKKADITVINTCVVRERAEHRSISKIGFLEKWKERNPGRKIFVVGCAAEKLGIKYIKSKFPFVDEVVGAKSLDKFDNVLSAYFKNENPDYKIPLNLFNSPFTAYVTIMKGCFLKCSYCIVPRVRGEAVYVSPEDVLREVKTKVSNGAREIILLGQTVNSYRHALNGKNVSFSKLLEMICKIDGVKRIRFMSPHPLYFDEGFFEVLKSDSRIARHAHLPVQSGSDKILKLMKRGYTRKKYLEILSKLKQAVPDIRISTDFIVGFPGETASDFADTISLLEQIRFISAYCFKYSVRTGSPQVKDSIPEREKEKRLEILLKTVRENSREIFKSRIGRIEETLFETEKTGKSSTNFNVETDSKQKPGETAQIEICGVHKNVLQGRPIP
ncbi:MAG: tRNA (N6-isopentenyl adenosine(37)-C2)-methylthiotransferase MiaB [Elusimicrobia bacterium]|nr:tRNA (N6-isopentenyl adenosine(37)-C2)-methylthiotransferase MiaB [Elusimicrobiota bacterium]